MKRLNFGCGNDYKEGWLNADLYADRVDLRFDFDKFPYPLQDNEFDYICALQVLEHLRYSDKAMEELHRALKPNGILEITVPHYTTAGAFVFRHHKQFSTRAIRDFTDEDRPQNELALRGIKFRLISSTRKLRVLHWDIGGITLDFFPVWDSIRWVVKKE